MVNNGRWNFVFCAVAVLASSQALGQLTSVNPLLDTRNNFEEDYDAKKWEEIETQLPAAPKPENLKSIYVSAGTENRFSVDTASVSVGKDGVVRYTLVVETPGGARNVSFEGMRCSTRERRPYAFGRADGSWSKARRNEWTKLREAEVNRHYAALFLGYFCPDGVIVTNREEALAWIQSGGKNYQTGRAY